MRDTSLNLPFFHSFFLSKCGGIVPLHLHTGYDSIIQTCLSPSPISSCPDSSPLFPHSALFRDLKWPRRLHTIFYPLNIILPTPRRANYSQINNVLNLFGIISGSFCLPLCRDRRGKAISTPGPTSNYVSNYLS